MDELRNWRAVIHISHNKRHMFLQTSRQSGITVLLKSKIRSLQNKFSNFHLEWSPKFSLQRSCIFVNLSPSWVNNSHRIVNVRFRQPMGLEHVGEELRIAKPIKIAARIRTVIPLSQSHKSCNCKISPFQDSRFSKISLSRNLLSQTNECEFRGSLAVR